MSAFDSIVSITTSLASVPFTRAGFGVPLIVAHTTAFGGKTKTYSGDILAAMATDFGVGDPIYRIASKMLSQTQTPAQIIVGRLEDDYDDHKVTLIPLTFATNYIYALKLNAGGISADVSVTVAAADVDAEDIVDKLVTVINATTVPVTASKVGSTTTATCLITCDEVTDIVEVDGAELGKLGLRDASPDTATGLATELAAFAADSSAWYAILLAINSAPWAEAAATWATANRRLLLIDASNSDTATGATSVYNQAKDIVATQTNRAAIWYHPNMSARTAAAVAGKLLPTSPGSVTWAHQTLVGVPGFDAKGSTPTTLSDEKINYYRAYGRNLNTTIDGVVAGGVYGYIDVTRAIDWLNARAQESLVALLAAAPKIPYTTGGVETLAAVLDRVVDLAVATEVLAAGSPGDPADPPPRVVRPNVSDATLANKESRTLVGLVIQGRLAGAIHRINLAINLTL